MKKLFILILTILGIGLSFCSSVNYSIIYDGNQDWTYTPNLFTFSDTVELSVVDYVCNYEVCKINVMLPAPDFTDVCMIWYNYFGGGEIYNTCSSLSPGTYLFGGAMEGNYSSITLSDGNSSGGGDSGGGDSGGGDSGGGDSGGGDSGGGHDSPTPYNGNIIESISGANLILNDTALSSGIGEPMFFWYGQLLNVAIKFFPVILVVSMFWFIYGYLKNLGNKNSLDSKKSLDNK